VDRVGQSSALEEQARRAGACVIQMSLSHWPRQLAQWMADRYGCHHALMNIPAAGLAAYFQKQLQTVRFEDFIHRLKVDDD
jgi:hypothetical protein